MDNCRCKQGMRWIRRAFVVAVAAVCGAAWADRTVSENLTLTRDLDWSGDVVTVANGVTIDLNGHVLKVSGLAGSTAASGVVTSSQGGELRFVVPAGVTNTLSKTRLAGSLRVFKEGPGGLVLGLSGQTYNGGTEVVEGTISPSAAGSTTEFGALHSEIRVDAGGVLDFKGKSDFVDYKFNLYGGRLHNSGSDVSEKTRLLTEVNLFADSTVSGNRFGFVAKNYWLVYLNLNGHTLTVEMAAPSTIFHICHAMIGEGKIHLVRGRLNFYGGNSSSKYRNYAHDVDIVGEVGTDMYVNNYGYLHARSITTKGRMSGSNWFYVGRYVHDVSEGLVATNSAPLGVASPNQLFVSITKKGKGVLALGNSHNGNLTNGIFATEGCIKLIENMALGKDKENPVEISAGATIDANGIFDGNVAGSLLFAGDGWDGNGAIQNTGASQDYYHTFPITAADMTLTGHASIGGTGDFGFVNHDYDANTLNLGGYTLTKKGSNRLSLAFTTVTGTGPFVIAGGSLGALGTCVVEAPLIFKLGTSLDLSVVYPSKVGDLTLHDCTMEPGATIVGSAAGSALDLAGTFTGASSFPCTNLTLKAGAVLVLPAGASKFTCAGRFTVADDSAVLDVSTLFANGEPAGNEVTVLTAGGVGGVPAIRGASPGWTAVNTGAALKLVKDAAAATSLPSLSSELVCVNAATTFDIPAALGATLEPGVYTLASWNVCATGYGAPKLNVAGCPYETELVCGNYDVKLHVKSPAESAAKPVKIWAVGDDRVDGGGGSWRIPLAQKLSLAGWNVQMTGVRTTSATEPSGATTRTAWKRHTGVPSLAIKTTPGYAGLLEGLETHCAAAQEPDFTILQLGTFDYWATNNYFDAATVVSHWREACDRILAALPDTVLVVTTVMEDAYTGHGLDDANYAVQKATRAALNAAIREQVALDEANGGFPAGRVALVDLDQLVAPTPETWSNNWRQTPAGNARVADALRDKLVTLGTGAGKNGAPKVYKVRNALALDGKFLAVTFNKPVAAPPASATLAAAGGSPVALADRTLSDDGRTVTYALADELVARTAYTLVLGAVADTAGAERAGETFEFTPRVCGALNNVPAAYTDGFTRLAALELDDKPTFKQNTGLVPYAWRTDLPKSGVTKAGYYIELVRKDTGEMQAMWIDMDSPGTSFDSFSLPVTLAQRKQQQVKKLHVWSDYGGVRNVPADDDSVTGFIEFCPVNFNQNPANASGTSDEYWSAVFDWNDTLNTSGASGFACFQIFRQFADGEDALPAEALFVFNHWGNSFTDNAAIGFGTFADRKVFASSVCLDRTYVYGTDDRANLCSAAYSLMRIEFWAKCTPAASRADYTDGAWTGAADATSFADAANWSASSLTGARLYLPANAEPVTFTYPAANPVALNPTLYVDGSYAFSGVGAFNLATLDFGATGRIAFDPAKTSFRLLTAPKFAAGAKIALDAKYAAATKGRFLLFTWDHGSLEAGTDLASLFDASSASGANPSVYEERLEKGGRLWLDLDVAASLMPFRVLPVGDSITQGNQSSYGNWRIPLMKKLCAAGFDPTATGLWKIQSFDEAGAEMPEKWSWHSGVSGRRLITGTGGGVLDAIEAELDQAGDVDVLLLKIGTNDINSDGTTAEELYAAWLELVGKILAQSSCKVVCGAVVNIADEAKNAQVTAFNARIKAAIEDGTTFPAGRVYFADLYSACPRYDGGGNYVEGNFYDATNVHPDWPGEDAIAEEYCRVIQLALAGGLPAHVSPSTTSGCMNNVPAAYREGFSLAGVIDATRTESLLNDPYVERGRGPTNNILRVGYYIELKRKDTEITCYYDRIRWLWVDMAAFGDRTLDTVGLPVGGTSWQPVNALHVIGNMPGISAVAADDDSVRGWVEFSPFNYSSGTSGLVGAPPHTYGYDWNDICSYSGSHASMQVHRFLEGARHPAQVLFAFNHWATAGACELGIGNYACHTKASLDWTFTSRRDQADLTTLDSLAYEVARIEVWTADAVSLAGDAPAPAGVDSLTWRPQVWTDTTAGRVWRNAADAASTTDYFFMPGFDMAFDGVAAYKSVNVPALMAADAVTISGDGNYVFDGAGSIAANTLTVDLAPGAVATLKGGGISAPDIVIAGGTLKLTTNLVASALGAGADGRITVADGGRLALEYLYTNTANAAYSSLVYDKDIHIAGDGPDGEGAIYHANDLANSIWFSTLGRVTLDADASIGGNARTDFRAGWGGRTYKGRPRIDGHGKTLTVKLRLANRSANQGLNLNNTDVAVGKVVVDEGATLGVEGTVNWDIPDGVDLLDGARLDCWTATVVGTGTIRIKAGCTAEFRGLSSNSFLFVPVIVEEGATLVISGGNTVCFEGGLDNRGAIRQDGGNIYLLDDGTVNGLEVTNLTYAAGNIYIGQYVQGGIPKLGRFEVTGESTGIIYLRTAEDTVIDGSTFIVKAPKAQVRFLCRADRSVPTEAVPRITVRNAANWKVGQFKFGDKTTCGSVVFDGGTVTVGYMQTSESTDHLVGRIELVNGASLSVTNAGNAFNLASTTSRSEMREHQVIVGPGCTFSTPNGSFVNGYSAPYAYFEMNEGSTVNLKGVWGRRRYNGIPAPVKHDSVFRMNGGTLNVGAYGFLAGYPAHAGSSQSSEGLNTHYNESGPVFRLNNGTLGAFEDTVDNTSYRAPGVNIAFGERADLAGKVSITPNGHVLNLRTGLKGWSDVTVKGGGAFQSSRYFMGIPRGHWKVEAGVDAELHGAAGFAGGLELAPGATARVCAATTNLVEAYAGSQASAAVLATNYFPHYATDLHYVHRYKHAEGPSYHTFAYRGEFLVTEENAGTWYFYGTFDDHIRMMVDGVNLTSGSVVQGHIDLAAGWHAFVVAMDDGYGSQGNTWGPAMGLGFRVGSDGGTTIGNYTRFDTTTLAMRPSRAVEWWRKKYAANWSISGSFSTYLDFPLQDFDAMSLTNTVKLCNVTDAKAKTNLFQRAHNRLVGTFYVPEEQAGWWHVKCGFDDFSAILLDDVLVAGVPTYAYTSASWWYAEKGWHSFEMHFGDTSGGFGVNGQSGIASKAMVAVSVNGGSYVAFDEDHFQIGVTPFVGLAGATTLGAGATLTNDGDAAYPITGTLWGSGTLAGKFAFRGGRLGVTIDGATHETAAYADADEATFADLGGVECRIRRPGTKSRYLLGDAMGLTDEAARALGISFTIDDGVDEDAAARYVEQAHCEVQDGKLYIVNPSIGGMRLFIR